MIGDSSFRSLCTQISARASKLTVIADALTVFNLAVASQMASRFIKTASLLDVAAGFVRLSLTHFSDCPSVVRVLELGNDPRYDIRAGVTLQ